MRKFVLSEKLPSGAYSVRHWGPCPCTDHDKKPLNPKFFYREWRSTYEEAKKRENEITTRLLAFKQNLPDPTVTPLHIVERYLDSLAQTHRPITIKMKHDTLIPFATASQFITEKRVKEWMDGMAAKGYSVSTIAIRLRDLKACCKWAMKEKLLQEYPFSNIKVPTAKEQGRKLSISEIEQIFEASDEKFKPFLGFLVYTGARRGEILKAKWDDLDLENKVWRIPAENCKTKRERYVPLDDKLVELIQTLPNPHPLVFHHFSRHTPSHLLRKACAKLHIAHPRIHDFRHSYASHWSGDTRILMDKLGWKSMAMVKRYSHFNVEQIRKESDQKGIAGRIQLNGSSSEEPKLKVI